MKKEKFYFNEDIQKAINQWKSKHLERACSFDHNHFEKVFTAIYAFRGVVDVIDEEIAGHCESSWEEVKLKTARGVTTIEIECAPKYKPLADTWSKLDDFHYTTTEATNLGIEITTALKLRYANYMGFIHSIIDYDYIVYEKE